MKSFSASGPISGVLRRPEDRPGIGRLSTVRWSLLLVALTLAVIGAATIHSATAETGGQYLPRQSLWVAIGMGLLVLTFSISYLRLASFAVPLYVVSIVLLVLVLVVGVVRGGARGWFALGPFAFQPAELAKLTTTLLLARYLAGIAGEHLKLKELLVTAALAGVPMALIAVQPDLGGAAMFAPMVAGMVLVAGVKRRWLIAATVTVVATLVLVWTFGLRPYQRERITTFLNPESDPLGAGYQVQQSKIAVGSGELLGKGYMQGTQSQGRFLPARHTDFIFAVLAEEWGFVGVALCLGLYALFLFGGAEVASRARDRLGILLVVGLLSVLAFHTLYNTAMVVGLVPITGIPVPFLSYGGTFTLFSFAATGLILNVDFRRYVNR